MWSRPRERSPRVIAERLFAVLGASVVRVAGASEPEREPDRLFGAWLDQGKTLAASLDAALSDADGASTLVIAGQDQSAIQATEAALRGRAGATLLALTWFDRGGAYADWRANDAALQALTGVAYAFGKREGPPVLAQGHAPQLVGGLVGFIASLAGLMNESGGPSRIDVNVHLEAALCFAETGWPSCCRRQRV